VHAREPTRTDRVDVVALKGSCVGMPPRVKRSEVHHHELLASRPRREGRREGRRQAGRGRKVGLHASHAAAPLGQERAARAAKAGNLLRSGRIVRLSIIHSTK